MRACAWFGLAAGAALCLNAAAQERAQTGAGGDARSDTPALDLSALDSLDRMGRVDIAADRAELRADAPSRFEGNVEITREGGSVRADAATYHPEDQRFSVEGNVGYEDETITVGADSARFDAEEDLGEFAAASFTLKSGDGRGDARRIIAVGDRSLELQDVRYSACPEGENDWRLIADRVRVDRENDIGEGRNVRVEFKGVPILYAPYLSFPASGARKTGILLPDYGNTERSGNDLSVPFYWNIAPNYDATITPRYLSARGTQIGIQGRYLFPETTGSIETVYLGGDMRANRDRYLGNWLHDSHFTNGLRLRADVTDVSDRDYFGDLSSSLAGTAITHLERLVELGLDREQWSLDVRMQSFQTIDDGITEDNEPYKRVPQLLFRGGWDTPLWTRTSVNAELTHFERDIGARGQRFTLEPTFSLPLQTPGASLVPSVRLNHTQYKLTDLQSIGGPEDEDDPSRTVPIYSLDGRLVFERMDRGGRFLQTLEPRFRYTHIPFVDQSDIPVFDTGLPDVNLVQLFQDNRFRGSDRIGDTDTVSFGFTTRLYNTSNGREMLNVTLGQAIFLSDRNVQLPGRPVVPGNSSNVIAEIAMNFSRRWNGNFEYQWQPELKQTAKAALRLQYRPAENKVLNLGYRFQDNELEQTDISFAWPIGRHWNVVGRWNYSLTDNVTLERFAGVEYERCCWAVRLVSRQFVNNRDGGNDRALFAQFELKGLTSIGTRVDAFLERGILGYGRINP
ncbi:MAG: LPS assembly protein LptD [Pseudomonadota bacterium]